MKSFKTRVVLVALMLGTLTSFANNSELGVKKIKIAFNDVKKGHELTIKNNEGVILHSEEVERKGDLVKVFDFSKLERSKLEIIENLEGNRIIENLRKIKMVTTPFHGISIDTPEDLINAEKFNSQYCRAPLSW